MAGEREMPKMPTTDEASKAFFRELVPEHPKITVRAMFGGVAAFANGNMFAGVHGASLFLRLPEDAREELAAAGGGAFEPMPGRPMGEYAVVPAAWREDPDKVEGWFERSMEHALAMPPKPPKKKRS